MIIFHNQVIGFKLKEKEKTRKWLKAVIANEKKEFRQIDIILCSDDYLRALNKKYLSHDYFTDVISFNYTEADIKISGDIFISLDRVRENAQKFEKEEDEELRRVMVHGVLHLLGYNDVNRSEKEIMQENEDFYLNLFPN